MRLPILAIGLVALVLAGCQKPATGGMTGGSARGRYVGVGLYHPGDLWRQVARASAPADAAAARLEDDDQVIVTLDSASGELRQCGNLSGYCVAMNPWGRPADQRAPTALLKHASELEAEAARSAGQAR